ncbi:hypothetical protein [Curtobacterium ammoniigenes]|nr:hypothetical protein [Curtobacterium ammoniigenes]
MSPSTLSRPVAVEGRSDPRGWLRDPDRRTSRVAALLIPATATPENAAA